MLCDSNILIDYLNGDQRIIELLQNWFKQGRLLLISSITTIEVLALPTLAPKDISTASSFLKQFISIPLNDPIAFQAAAISRIYQLRVPDSAIAASAISHRLILVTRDKQLRKVKELEIFSP